MEPFKSKSFSYLPTAALLLAGLLVFVLLGAGAPLTQALRGDDSSAWLPIAGIDAYPSDEYYSMDVIASVIHAGEVPLTSSQAEQILPRWERKRFSTIGVAAAFSLFLDDIRQALLSGLLVTSVLYFLLPVVGFWLLTGNPRSGLLPAILFFLWPSGWSTLSSLDPLLAEGELMGWGLTVFERIGQTFFLIAEVRNPEYVTQTLRMPFPGTAFLQLTLFFFALMAFFSRITVPRLLLLALATYVILFSYQPVLVVACLSILSVFLVALLHKNYKASALFLVLGCSVLLYLVLSGYREGVVADMRSHAVVAHLIGDGAGQIALEISLSDIWQVLINRYSITGAFCLAVVWRHPSLRTFVLSVLVACLLIKMAASFDLLPKTYGRRLERRGIDPLWMMAMGISLWYGWQRLLDRLSDSRWRQAVHAGGILAVCGLFAFPAVSFWRYAANDQVAEAYRIETAQWELLRWLQQNGRDGETVVTRDWLDLHYIRIFSGRQTSFATIMNSGRRPEAEIRDYIGSLKALGFSRDYVVEQFSRSAGAYSAYREDYLRYRRVRSAEEHPKTFRDPPEAFNAAWVYHGLLRTKWFPRILETEVLEAPDRVSEAFLRRIGETFDSLPAAETGQAAAGSRLFVLRRQDILQTRDGRWNACGEAYENRSYRVFRC